MLTFQKTPLHANHLRRGAKMVDFAGWEMPLQFGKVLAEHQAVRQAAGLFDISHMGLVSLHCGQPLQTQEFIDSIVPQDIQSLYPGKALYTQFLNDQGGIIDDIIVYRLPEPEISAKAPFPEFQEFLIICNAGNTEKDIAWMKAHAPQGLQVNLLSNQYGLLALQGPRFKEVLQRLGYPLEVLPKRFHISNAEFSVDTGKTVPAFIARTGYTGEDGVELIVSREDIETLWEAILNQGNTLGVLPIGLAARDTLRLEAAFPLHGHDISEQDSPLEAGLGWTVKLDKSISFIGQEALRRQQQTGLAKKLFCFKLKKKMIPRQYDALLKDGRMIGEVTSGSISPLLNEPIGMGYIDASVPIEAGNLIQVRIRNSDVDAEIVERPFYKAR